VSAARRTLGRWLIAAFLERGCDPTTVRRPRRVFAVRPLTSRELAELNPFADPLVPLHNLRLLSSRARTRRPADPVARLSAGA
jgi:hypothetical protein